MLKGLSGGLVAAVLALVLGLPASAMTVINYSGYDVNDAVLSGHGGWAHSYGGVITPGVPFSNFTNPGATGTYSGVGSGTLNDGVIGGSILTSQLFVTPSSSDGLVIQPTIFLTLPVAETVHSIELYGGDVLDNGIPGSLTGVTVSLLKTDFTTVSETFTTTPFGPVATAPDSSTQQVNDRISLAGSTLANTPAFLVTLSNFQGTNSNWFSLTEIVLVPEPAATALLLAAGCIVCMRRRSPLRR